MVFPLDVSLLHGLWRRCRLGRRRRRLRRRSIGGHRFSRACVGIAGDNTGVPSAMAAGVHVVRVPAKLASLAKLNLLFGAVELPACSRSSEGGRRCASGRTERGEQEGERAEGKDGAHDFSCQLSMNGAKRRSCGRIVSAARQLGSRRTVGAECRDRHGRRLRYAATQLFAMLTDSKERGHCRGDSKWDDLID